MKKTDAHGKNNPGDYRSRIRTVAMEFCRNNGDYETWKENFMENMLGIPKPPPCSEEMISRIEEWKKANRTNHE